MDPSRIALLVMDVQDGIVERLGSTDFVERVAAAADAARRSGIRVIYVVIGFREGYPEVSRRNRSFSQISGSGQFTGGPGSGIHERVAPRDGDLIVTKKRVSAFVGSDLAMILRAGDYESLVLAGIATSGVVLSTLRQAADLDFDLTVLADGCSDGDEEVHRVLTEKVFPRQARVLSVAEWTASLEELPAGAGDRPRPAGSA
jgi:nicotinamidase-related amidase